MVKITDNNKGMVQVSRQATSLNDRQADLAKLLAKMPSFNKAHFKIRPLTTAEIGAEQKRQDLRNMAIERVKAQEIKASTLRTVLTTKMSLPLDSNKNNNNKNNILKNTNSNNVFKSKAQQLASKL